jgi:hypothetical protein
MTKEYLINRSFGLKDTNEIDAEDAAIALFDADQDQDLDIVLASGSYENLMAGKNAYNVRLYINDGKGHFTRDIKSIHSNSGKEPIRTCASTLRVADIDLDGDLDIFIGGQVLPGYYPKHDQSFILINQSTPGKVSFEDQTSLWAPSLQEAGMINDAIWSDYNNDGKPDLVLAVEWGPITIFKNDGHTLTRIQSKILDENKGWWTSLTSGDFDHDGDIDYVAGNFGQNVYFKCNSGNQLRSMQRTLIKMEVWIRSSPATGGIHLEIKRNIFLMVGMK